MVLISVLSELTNAIVGVDGKPAATDFDTIAFKLEVKCEKNSHAEKEESDPHRAFKHANGTTKNRNPNG